MTVLVLERGSYKLVSFRPYWLPFNDKAHQLCAEIVSALELKDTTKASEKSLLTVASFLFAAQRIIRIQQRQGDQSEELLSNLVFESFWSCGDLAFWGGFNSVFERDACDDFGEVVKAA